MSIDQNADHAQGSVKFYEAHSAHVARKVVNLITSLHHPVAGFFFLKIHYVILRAFVDLIPLIQWFDIGYDHLVPLRE